MTHLVCHICHSRLDQLQVAVAIAVFQVDVSLFPGKLCLSCYYVSHCDGHLIYNLHNQSLILKVLNYIRLVSSIMDVVWR
jgi:hypothetical protein